MFIQVPDDKLAISTTFDPHHNCQCVRCASATLVCGHRILKWEAMFYRNGVVVRPSICRYKHGALEGHSTTFPIRVSLTPIDAWSASIQSTGRSPTCARTSIYTTRSSSEASNTCALPYDGTKINTKAEVPMDPSLPN